jgi:hypothetical protein
MENNIQKEDLLALVKSKIYTIRGQKVMLDFDLAQMYEVETRVLNQSVKRNIERFPDDFMFQLTKGELDILKSQFVISKMTEIQVDENLKSQNATSKPFCKLLRKKCTLGCWQNKWGRSLNKIVSLHTSFYF